MENIKIIDNFFSKEELNKIQNVLNNKEKEWHYGHNSGDYEKYNNNFFAVYILGNYFKTNIIKKFEEIFNKKFQLIRNYMHIQTYGQDGSYHLDCPEDIENTYTFCIYITDISDSDMENADGDFLLKIPNSNFIICINTLNNRGVFFQSTYFHKGMAYNRFYNNKRLCITWKLKEII